MRTINVRFVPVTPFAQDDYNVCVGDRAIGTFCWRPTLTRGGVSRVAEVVHAGSGAMAIVPDEAGAAEWFERHEREELLEV